MLPRAIDHLIAGALTTCPACGGRWEVLAVFVNSTAVRRILHHVDLPTATARRHLAHARRPPAGPDGDGPTVDELLTDELP